MAKKQANKKKEAQSQRDRLAAAKAKQQQAAAAAAPTTASDDDEADSDTGQHSSHQQQRRCAHLRALLSARYKPLAADVQVWLSKQATAAAAADDAPTVLCLECGYQGPPPSVQPESKEHRAKEEADDEEKKETAEENETKQPPPELKQPEEHSPSQPTDETKEQLTTPPPSSPTPTPTAEASHFHVTHFVGLRLSSQPSLADCVCFRCNVTLADALIQSPQHARLTKLASFITSLVPSATTSPSPSSPSSSDSAAAPSPSSAPSSAALSSSGLSSLSLGSDMRGLANLGNTCFFNSVVQCLAASQPLLAALFPPPSTPHPLQHQLSLFLTNMNIPLSSLASLPSTNAKRKPSSLSSSASSSYTPTALLAAVQSTHPQFKGQRQQDAHELLRAILSALATESEEKDRKRRREQLVAAVRQWEPEEVGRVVASAGMAGGREGEVMKRLEEIAVKEKESGVVDGAVVIMLLEKWETKEGKRWRRSLTDCLDDTDKKRLERTFTAMRQGKLPPLTTAADHSTAQHSPVDSDAKEEEGEEVEEGGGGRVGRRSVVLPGDSVVHSVFGGVMEQCVTCLSCGAASWTEEIFFDLSLPIEPPRLIEFKQPAAKERRAAPIVNLGKAKAAVVAADKAKKDSDAERKAKDDAAQQRERVKQEQSAKLAAAKEETERQYLLRLEEAQREEVTLPSVVRRKKQQPAQFARKGQKLSQAEKRKMKEKEKERRKSGGRVEGAGVSQQEEEKEEEEEDSKEGHGQDEEEAQQDERKEHSSQEERKDAEESSDSSVKLEEVEERKEELKDEREERKQQLVDEESNSTVTDHRSTAHSDNTAQPPEEHKEERVTPLPQSGEAVVFEHKQHFTSAREVIDLTGDSDDDEDATIAQLTAHIDQLSVTAPTPQPPSEPATSTTPSTTDKPAPAPPTSSQSASSAPSPSLSVGVSRLSGACTVWDCLQSFFDPELLTGSNQFNCSSCSSVTSLSSSTSATSSAPVVCKRDATRRYYLRLLPPVVTIHLKRFSASASGRTMEKLNKAVAFPAQLDLSPFTRSSAGVGGGSVYGLYGVVCHSGGMGGGHYVCFVRRGGGGWWYASDSSVREVGESEVLKAQAYILFYERLGGRQGDDQHR